MRFLARNSVRLASLIAALSASLVTAQPATISAGATEHADTAEQYRSQAAAELAERLTADERPGKARNLIIFIGDGMGVSTLTAARIMAGQGAGIDGESHVTAMDTLDHTALVKTYSHDGQVSDSASTATAIMAGIKTRNGVLGMGPETARGICPGPDVDAVPSLFDLAQRASLATGIVTTTRITHATPAAAYAHSPQRDWEADGDMSPQSYSAGCRDIASQLVEGPVGTRLDVIMGGGRRAFLPASMADPEHPEQKGGRKDGRDLTAAWQKANPEGSYVWTADQFAAYDPASGGRLLALFEPSHMQFEADRAQDQGGEPALADMVRVAIERLSRGATPYVLLVEGGRIDHAHHGGNAYRALIDAAALDAAVAQALSMVDLDDTLVVTTADHSHVLTIAGYPERGNPILGVAANGGEALLGADGKAYTTLGYTNGPGAVAVGERPDPALTDTTAADYRQQALVPLGSETHGGEDVVVRASGPSARLFSGTMEQHTVFHVLHHALFGAPLDLPAAERQRTVPRR